MLNKKASVASKYLGQTLRLMVGIQDYDQYINHMKKNHPDKSPLSYEDFFKACQDSKYGANGNIKCC
ncbi:MAG: YbdD/YjiX family protein [Candidatus Kinetoplastibacterium crithidii]|nr:MAG: YbdD/YjiX family protein [Candidatus Kinetoplastibacterium crithidii]